MSDFPRKIDDFPLEHVFFVVAFHMSLKEGVLFGDA